VIAAIDIYRLVCFLPTDFLMSNRKGKKTSSFVKDDAPRRDGPRAPEKKFSQFNKRLGEFTINRMSHDGRGISEWNSKILFVDGALTGERVTARLVEEHSRYTDARIDEVLDASAYRQVPPCAHFAKCGGCQLQHLSIEHQLILKQDAVLEQLERWGGVIPKHIAAPITSAGEGYRRCARMSVWYEENGDVTLGFREAHSKHVVQVDHCIVLAPSLNALLAPLKVWLSELVAKKAVTHIEFIDVEQGAFLVLRCVKKLTDVDLFQLENLTKKWNVTAWLQNNDDADLKDLSGLSVGPRLVYRLPIFNLELGFHPQDFIQVNSSVNEKMIAQAIDWLAPSANERLLDLFCGIGNFTLPLARHCAEVFGLEAEESMVERGRENAMRAGITNATFLAADLLKTSENRLHQICGKVDAMLLDPPRDGAKEILTVLLQSAKAQQLKPKRIVYVSCNPATLARDAKILAEAGYQLDSLGVMDMFAHTAHIESMALFVLGKK
jgi:23S rRNA (uracil1939-C5)-methyltransferase